MKHKRNNNKTAENAIILSLGAKKHKRPQATSQKRNWIKWALKKGGNVAELLHISRSISFAINLFFSLKIAEAELGMNE